MSIDAVGVPEAPFDCRTQVTTSMEDFALYNQGYKALSLLITILASVVMNRLLSRGPLGIGSVRVCGCVYACVRVCVYVFECVCVPGVCHVSVCCVKYAYACGVCGVW